MLIEFYPRKISPFFWMVVWELASPNDWLFINHIQITEYLSQYLIFSGGFHEKKWCAHRYHWSGFSSAVNQHVEMERNQKNYVALFQFQISAPNRPKFILDIYLYTSFKWRVMNWTRNAIKCWYRKEITTYNTRPILMVWFIVMVNDLECADRINDRTPWTP